jgi:hypothetical protein
MKNLFVFIICLALIAGCEKDDEPSASPYPKLKGTYVYYRYVSWEHGLYERSTYVSWTFDNSNKASKYSCSWGYTTDGWYNASKDGYSFDMEWKMQDDKIYTRLWKDSSDPWMPAIFEYVNADTIKLDYTVFVRE